MISLAETGLFQEQQVKTLQRRGIRTVRDILFYFPRRYIDRSKVLDLSSTKVGDVVTFVGKVHIANVVYARRRRLVCSVHYQNLAIEIVFFQGIQYYSRVLQPGIECAFSGSIELFRNKFSMTHPEIEIMTEDELVHTGKIIPLYKITEAMRKNYLTGRTMREKIHAILAQFSSRIHDHLSRELKSRYQLLDLAEAFQKIHYPRALTGSLPFKFTSDQLAAVERLNGLIAEQSPFGVLLQGDVGSGKTLVALMTALNYMQREIQVAFMAPTEILARQHFRNFISFLSDFPFLQTELLLGKERAADKRAKLDRIKRGETLLVVGTHSLIQESLEFKSLGLIIIDEQHRFGVEKRD